MHLRRGGTSVGQLRVKLANQVKHTNGTIIVDTYGQIFSPGNLQVSDCFLWAIHTPTNRIIAYAPIWILIPRAVGLPHPTADGSVTPVNQAATGSTSPAYFGSLLAGNVVLWTYWAQWLSVPVVDQFKDDLIALYDGQPVKEYSGGWKPINQNVNNASYQDPVFVFRYKDDQTSPFIVSASSQEAAGAASSAPIVTPCAARRP